MHNLQKYKYKLVWQTETPKLHWARPPRVQQSSSRHVPDASVLCAPSQLLTVVRHDAQS